MNYQKLESRGKAVDKNLRKFCEYSVQGKQHATFEEAEVGQEIEVTSGTVWVTQYGDIRDYTVRTGSHFTITRPGLVLVGAVGDDQASFLMK